MQALAVAVSNSAVCAIDTLRVTRCWGSLGSNDINGPIPPYGNTPVVVDSTLRFTAIAGGWYHFCALTEAGAAWCWGLPDGGALGTGVGAVASALPQQVAGGQTFTSIAANWRTTCALDAAGQAWCWGSPGEGSLGTGNLTEVVPATVIQGSTVFTSISLGYDHICALDTNKAAWCWGHQDVGQLGDSLFVDANAPHLVAGGKQYASIAAGDHFTCAIGLDRAAWCWGTPPLSPYHEYGVPTPIGVNGLTQLLGDTEYLVGVQTGRPVAAGSAWYIGIPEELSGATLTPMPGGLYAIDRMAFRWATICMIRADDQLFCTGEVPGYGTTAVPVGIPAP
jgi:alpha-tubulin suppressor-like RCC1 family protein